MTKEERETQTNDTRQSILDAASILITQKGVKDTSLADIAKEVGISKGTLYYYYSSKNDIIYDITDRHLKDITEELLEWIANIKNDAAVEEIFEVVFEKILTAETRKLHLYLISDAVIGDTSLKEKFIEKYKEWRFTLETGMKMVLKDRPANSGILSYIILSVLDGLTIQRMLGIKELPLKEIAKHLTYMN